VTDAAAFLAAALDRLTAAAAQDWPATARTALINVGLAEAALGAESLVTAPSVAAEREALKAAAADTERLIARAAANIDTLLTQRDDDSALEDALLARTGYQDLLDMGTWPEPPLDDFHLGEVDEELADAVAASPPTVPPGIPPEHTWWRPAPK